jgi:hypothetical protein
LPSGFVTLERLFHYPALHFQAHTEELQALLVIARSRLGAEDQEYATWIEISLARFFESS